MVSLSSSLSIVGVVVIPCGGRRPSSLLTLPAIVVPRPCHPGPVLRHCPHAVPCCLVVSDRPLLLAIPIVADPPLSLAAPLVVVIPRSWHTTGGFRCCFQVS
ncbi:hypothetical protein L208DRAFT_528418 [Tricholoma matsutake]|nr:hypothetical protein L208DRAFT_528418 [Tricholoma matsutake 945]